MTKQHGKSHHANHRDDDDWNSPTQVRRQKRMRSMMQYTKRTMPSKISLSIW